MNQKYQPLFDRYTLPNGIELKNRLALAPMTHYSSNDDGTMSDAELIYIKERSKDFGLIITACANVTENGKAFVGQPGIFSDELLPSLKKWAKTIQDEGAKAVVQIHHGGRQCPTKLVPNGDVVSASDYFEEDKQIARALTNEEIEDIIVGFGEATRRAIEAGFDGVEIHGANTYLIQQFYSPYTNHRADKWGGSREKRMAFPLAVVDACQKAIETFATKPFILGYRFSPEEPSTPGLTMADTFQLVDTLADKGLDYLHISLADVQSTPHRDADPNRTRIELINELINGRVPFMAVGQINTPDEALAVRNQGIPLLALGRELLIEPRWADKIQNGYENEIEYALHINEKDKYLLPENLWNIIINREGWVPLKR
ncbi:NADH-dependent flavin oxidoreductase [Alkalihalobacillus sp. 1P02AB]|uniref:NADH-dependent flavin oxidoreductase n=1 Tax=Alkalihalobacillus sp. 1P02AB TaxID=3132260 RepID=UPI0039A4DCF9